MTGFPVHLHLSKHDKQAYRKDDTHVETSDEILYTGSIRLTHIPHPLIHVQVPTHLCVTELGEGDVMISAFVTTRWSIWS
jgi:hypothetical protein